MVYSVLSISTVLKARPNVLRANRLAQTVFNYSYTLYLNIANILYLFKTIIHGGLRWGGGGHTHSMWKFLGQGWNLHHSCSNAGCLTHCTRKKVPNLCILTEDPESWSICLFSTKTELRSTFSFPCKSGRAESSHISKRSHVFVMVSTAFSHSSIVNIFTGISTEPNGLPFLWQAQSAFLN